MRFQLTFLVALLGVYLFLPRGSKLKVATFDNVTKNFNEIQLAEKKSTLAEDLKNGLQTRRPNDLTFINLVVEKVNNKSLPINIVRETFAWARNKPRRKFQYFRFGLIARAKKIGVQL